MADEILIDPEAGADLAYIQEWDTRSRWYPALKAAIETIPLLPPFVYNVGPDGAIKFQPINTWLSAGVPIYHIVWEKKLDGFRPMILKIEVPEVLLLTGIAVERDNLNIPGLPGHVRYEDPHDVQIRRVLDRFKRITGRSVPGA